MLGVYLCIVNALYYIKMVLSCCGLVSKFTHLYHSKLLVIIIFLYHKWSKYSTIYYRCTYYPVTVITILFIYDEDVCIYIFYRCFIFSYGIELHYPSSCICLGENLLDLVCPSVTYRVFDLIWTAFNCHQNNKFQFDCLCKFVSHIN